AAQRLAQADNGVLGRDVGGDARHAELPRLRGDVDDVAAIARDHLAQRDLAAVDHAVDVDVDLAVRAGVVLVDEAPDRHDAGVVDEDVDGAERALDLVGELLDRLALGHVEVEADGAATQLLGGAPGAVAVDVADG